jgi:hypothetical protein
MMILPWLTLGFLAAPEPSALANAVQTEKAM